MSTSPEKESNRLESWNQAWETNQIGFHLSEVHAMLTKYYGKLTDNGQTKKIFVPLCGKSLDMKWLADQGMEVVGVEGVKIPLEQFFSENGFKWTEESIPGAVAFKRTDNKIRLYCCDMMTFSPAIEGTFDAMWDRGSLIALDRDDIPTYVAVMKGLLNPGGRILVEVMEYDMTVMDELENAKPQPPHAIFEDEMKGLFEPDCTVEYLERAGRTIEGEDIIFAFYLITKKTS